MSGKLGDVGIDLLRGGNVGVGFRRVTYRLLASDRPSMADGENGSAGRC
jgi:hypothetical protein